jgi:hypothetical protein
MEIEFIEDGVRLHRKAQLELAPKFPETGAHLSGCLPAMCGVTYLDAIQEETTASMSDAVLSGWAATTTTKMGIKGQGSFVTAQLPPGRRDKRRISPEPKYANLRAVATLRSVASRSLPGLTAA